MPVEAIARAPTRTAAQFAVNPRYRTVLEACGLDDPGTILELPGEVVSGHADRHVMRVEIPGVGTCYLKRQHRVGLRERFRQWRAGWGWVSRSLCEARILQELHAEGFAAPEWIATGECDGRAFLLVEELNGYRELRLFLGDTALSPADRSIAIERCAAAIAELHVAGFATPDLSAKHVFIDPDTFAVALIDWQNSHRTLTPSQSGLAALHASLPAALASLRDRLRFLRTYCWTAGTAKPFSVLARCIGRDAESLASRRSIRDQRQPAVTGVDQRLVWLAGEAVCAIPEVAAHWPDPPLVAPFYSDKPAGDTVMELPDGRAAMLVRGRAFVPLRNRSWRSPGATIGRVLFHLQRYGIPAPQLFAFGQRFTGWAFAEWFALFEPLSQDYVCGPSSQFEELLAKLHDSGCRPDFRRGLPFRTVNGRVMVVDPRGLRIVRRVHQRDRTADRAALFHALRAG